MYDCLDLNQDDKLQHLVKHLKEPEGKSLYWQLISQRYRNKPHQYNAAAKKSTAPAPVLDFSKRFYFT